MFRPSLARFVRNVGALEKPGVRLMCMWPERFESPLSLEELNQIKNTPEYNRKAAVPIKAAAKDANMAYFQNDLMKKFSKMVTNHNDGMLGEQLMMKLYNKLKEVQLEKLKNNENVEVDPTRIILAAVENARPVMRLEKVKVGAITYMVPTPITSTRSYFEGMRWIHHAARDNRANPRWVWRKKNPNEPVPKSVSIWDALAREILDAYANTGRAVAKKIEYHRKMFILILKILFSFKKEI
ncbi:28S ribosomal protein S7, mitochondrial-like [Eurytemora carolleeae]|uniref:28S ribosomal protein S7, mitochondrial-like n=1 Tax=Eurytemora carolleeae TaxID=1294199 RepID=UPI000C7637BB|nr:28S ribosomal protein S7, mitochondrial-like [Eurytemora carolleeae]|eukprot:XP_023341443.1 28S ribosomal protein S7, mitochondrial-like [Eurytemora affinis]